MWTMRLHAGPVKAGEDLFAITPSALVAASALKRCLRQYAPLLTYERFTELLETGGGGSSLRCPQRCSSGHA